MTRALSPALLPLLLSPLAACGDDELPEPTVSLSGHAMDFGSGGRIEGAEVHILEQPDRLAITDADGAFRFDGLPAHAEVTLVMDKEGFPTLRTGTFLLAGQDVERATFQAPTDYLYDLLASLAGATADPSLCQVATTITRRGNSLYDEIPGTHGEPGALASISPTPAQVDGPVYFDLIKYNIIFPSRELTESSSDGGVLFLNVAPGEYTLSAEKEGTTFRPVKVRCDAGALVNASPPWGLQALEGGVGPRTEPDWQ